jgi:hypothetical protein
MVVFGALLGSVTFPPTLWSRADVIVLTDGTRVDGKVTYESKDLLHVDTPGGLVVIETADIKERHVSAPPEAPIDEAEQQRIVTKIGEYTRQLRAIKRSYLDVGEGGKAERLFKRGRQRVLALDDPLAIGPLARILSRGNTRTRELLVEALSGFDDDEATMNLVATALLDPAEDIRLQAARVLSKRSDPRIVSDLRTALRSDEDEVVCNAAVALGVLRAREAALDLVNLLSFKRKVTMRIPRGDIVSAIQGSYISGIRYRVARGVAQAEPIIGVLTTGSAASYHPKKVRVTATVYRTEVQEALIAITGQNLGFDADKWRRWLAQHPATP